MATLQGEQWIVYDDMTGGVNSSVPPHQLNKNECPDIVNIEWDQTRFGKKRNGCSTIGDVAFSADIASLYHHVPIPGDANGELWGFDVTIPPLAKRLFLPSGTWQAVTVPDDIVNSTRMEFVTFNKKLFIAADSAVNRLHVWDGTVWRRVGLAAAAAAPTVANTGAGAYAAVLRYYKVSFTIVSGSDTVSRSELSVAQSFTPSGAGTHARVTMPTIPTGDVPTHWEVWGSADAANYYRLASTVVATTTYDDNATPSTYPTLGPLAPAAGENTPPTSWRYITTDGNRLIGAGEHLQSGAGTNLYANRVWFTPVTGASDIGDDERIPNTTTQKNWIDVDPNDGDSISGIAPYDGAIWIFKKRRMYKLIPTGNVAAPFQVVSVTGRGYGVGCIESRTLRTGEDEAGRPALYFCGERGPTRITQDAGIQFIGYNLRGYWNAIYQNNNTVQPLFAEWYPARTQYILFAAVRSETTGARTAMIFNARWGRPVSNGIVGGWVRYLYKNQDATGSAVIRCMSLYRGVASGGPAVKLQPHLSETGHFGDLRVMDFTGATDDAGVDFAAYLRLPELPYAGLGKQFELQKVVVAGKTQTSTTLQCRLTQNFGDIVLNAAFTLDPLSGSSQERRVIRVEDAITGPITTCEVRVGDGSAQDVTAWQLESVAMLIKPSADV